MQNTHQAKLVAQLWQEAQQWKGQCLRLEETLCGEVNAWKAQCLQINAEHTRLLYLLKYAMLTICLLGQHRYPDLV